jgi:4-hydroxybutyrate dehydrogenase
MKQFRIKTTIQLYDSAIEFCEEFQFHQDDLILTRRETYERYFKGHTGEAVVIDFRKYGSGEPTDQMVEAILTDLKDLTYRRVIAIGGGSILDVGKLLVLNHRSPVQELFERKHPLVKEKEFIAIPTTCGTGSEVTNISVMELREKNTKLGLAADELLADYAILIPELLQTLSFYSFAVSSIDAFVHALEAYLSPKANDITRMYSVEAMRLILRGYQRIALEGEGARFSLMKKYLMASTYAGIAFGNAGVAAVHALSYPLSSAFHLPHGEANYAVLWGVLWRYNKLKPQGTFKELNCLFADLLCCREGKLDQELRGLFRTILPGKSLKEYGASRSMLEEFTLSVLHNQGRLLANTYVELSQADILAIYEYLYE